MYFNEKTGGEEVTGILGPNGAGETTALRVIAGALKPTWIKAVLKREGYSSVVPDVLPAPDNSVRANSYRAIHKVRPHRLQDAGRLDIQVSV